MFRQGNAFPFANAMKFRHVALLVLALKLPSNLQERFAEDEEVALYFLNSLLRKTLETTDATYDNDKLFLITNIMRHFWNHLQFLGVRDQLMMAVLLFDKYRNAEHGFGEAILQQFLQISGDPDLNWLKEATFIDDAIFVGGLPQFEKSYFTTSVSLHW